MFITIKDISTGTLVEEPVNVYSINYLYIKELDNKECLIYVLINGLRKIEAFDSHSELQERLQELGNLSSGGLVQVDSYSDLPEKGSAGSIYITKDTGQTYYWDPNTETYITTGTAGRTGVYLYDGSLPTEIGDTATVNKTDLEEVVAPTVAYSEGSEISASNAVHGLIVSSTSTTVTVKTITDMTIDSFRQVDSLSDLPETGISNILYAVKDIKEFRAWDSTNSEYYRIPEVPEDSFTHFRVNTSTTFLSGDVYDSDFDIGVNRVNTGLTIGGSGSAVLGPLFKIKNYSDANIGDIIGYYFTGSAGINQSNWRYPGFSVITKASNDSSSYNSLSLQSYSFADTYIHNKLNTTYSGLLTFSTLPESSVTPTTNNQLTRKKYVDDSITSAKTQYSAMPAANSSNLGKIVEFTGATDSTYTNGYFYKCVSDGAETPTYSWENINVQDGASYTAGNEIEIDSNNKINLNEYRIGLTLERMYPSTLFPTDYRFSLSTASMTLIRDLIAEYEADQSKTRIPDIYFYNTNSITYNGKTFLANELVGRLNIVIAGNQYSTFKYMLYGVSYDFANPNGGSFAESMHYKLVIESGIKYTDASTAIQLFNPHLIINKDTSALNSKAAIFQDSSFNYFLTTDNNASYTPTADYHPATKKYVDDNAGGGDLFIADVKITRSIVLGSESTTLILDTTEQNAFKNAIASTVTKAYKAGKSTILVNFTFTNVTIGSNAGIKVSFQLYPDANLADKPTTGIRWAGLANYAYFSNPMCKGSNMHLCIRADLSWTTANIASVSYMEKPVCKTIIPLSTNNTTSYTPTGNYNPATKKYVDDSISTAVGNINTVLATLTTPSNNGGN